MQAVMCWSQRLSANQEHGQTDEGMLLGGFGRSPEQAVALRWPLDRPGVGLGRPVQTRYSTGRLRTVRGRLGLLRTVRGQALVRESLGRVD